MITSKAELKEYLAADKIALNKSNLNHPRFKHDIIWSFQILLRKCEYYENCRKDFVGKIIGKILKYRFVCLSQRLGCAIPFNVFGKGLSIAHYGCLVVNEQSVIGDFCRIHENVTIGITGDAYWGENTNCAAKIGNNVFIATGVKIIGNVKIADGVAIGANAVVVKDILEPYTSWGGIPAQKISDKGSSQYIRKE